MRLCSSFQITQLHNRTTAEPYNRRTMKNQLTYNWYALYTKSRHEKKVYEELVAQNIEAYIPIHTVIKQWSDRKKRLKSQ